MIQWEVRGERALDPVCSNRKSIHSHFCSFSTRNISICTPSSQSRDLDGNAFICNCHLAWFAEWLRREEGLFPSSGPKCVAPLRHKDALIRSLPGMSSGVRVREDSCFP